MQRRIEGTSEDEENIHKHTPRAKPRHTETHTHTEVEMNYDCGHLFLFLILYFHATSLFPAFFHHCSSSSSSAFILLSFPVHLYIGRIHPRQIRLCPAVWKAALKNKIK